MKLLKFDLGKTETYRERVAVWVGGGSTAAAGFLTITTRAGNRTTTVTYAADRVPDRPHFLAHLRPLREANDGGPYWVECRGGRWSCNCRGFRADTPCKHCDAVAAVKNAGELVDS
jgi:hypothetical protein